MLQKESCRLCKSSRTQSILRENSNYMGVLRRINYVKCVDCHYIQLSSDAILDEEAERERYGSHANCTNDEGYINYLKPSYDLVENYISVSNFKQESPRALDFGSGVAKPMEMICPDSWLVDSFDPFFYAEKPIDDFESQFYDVVFCIEVFEHLKWPLRELDHIQRCIKPGGLLSLRTEMYFDDMDFKNWWYRKDPTHIGFFTPKSIQVMASKSWEIVCMGRHHLLFKYKGLEGTGAMG